MTFRTRNASSIILSVWLYSPLFSLLKTCDISFIYASNIVQYSILSLSEAGEVGFIHPMGRTWLFFSALGRR